MWDVATGADTTTAPAPQTSAAPEDEMNVQLGAKTQMKVHRRAHGQRSNPHHDHVPSDEMDLLIETINSNDLGWKADVCKLQKHHHMYDADKCDKKDRVNLAQTGSFSEQLGEAFMGTDAVTDGKKSAEAKAFGQGPEFQQAWATLQKWQQYGKASEIPDAELPEQFDLRNVDGYDFTGAVRNQGACGSCYTVSFTQATESRLKVKYGKEVPTLSPQFLLSCNYMTEGCEGGWPHFHAYFAENGHLVEEKCAPYRAMTVGGKCSDYKDCPGVAKVSRSYDVGGAYGQSSEALMMKEVLRNGALCTEFQAPNLFATYSSGLFTAEGFEALHMMAAQETGDTKATDISTKTLNDRGFAWKNLNHSVIVVGWGVDKENG